MESQMTLIRHGKWSICYKKDNRFYKEYIYPSPQAIKREELVKQYGFSVLTLQSSLLQHFKKERHIPFLNIVIFSRQIQPQYKTTLHLPYKL